MLARVIALIGLAACSSPPAPAPPAEEAPADLILTNGSVHTMTPERPRVEAVAIRGERIVFAGAAGGAAAWRGPKTRVVDLDNAMVLPGFHDSHVHPVTGGIELGQCDLNGAESVAEVRRRVAEFAAAHPGERWIVGGGWGLPLFDGANPPASLLDELVPDRPAYLTAADAHSAWVNSKALTLAGIDRDTRDPPGGRIERDAAGRPSGTLREAAMELVSRHLPALDLDDHIAGLRRGLAMAARNGITSVYEASADAGVLAAYRALALRGELTARVVAAQRVDLAAGPAQAEAMGERRETLAAPGFRPLAAKIFLDGVIEAKTAALLEPYTGSDRRGELNLEPEALAALVAALDRRGLDVHIHAIGDRAIRASLDAFAAVRERNPARDRRHSIAHLQLIDPADVARFAELGVIADFQPLWAYADTYITELTEPVLGPERSRWLYPIKSVVDSGAVVVAGSDWSVSSMSPLAGIQVALTRRGTRAGAGEPWLGEQRVDLETALVAYTRAGAFLHRQEDRAGVIAAGKLADLVVLERDLFEIPPAEIHAVAVLATLVGGRPVHCAPAMCEQLGR